MGTPKGKVTGQGITVRLHLYSPNCSRNFQQQNWFPNTVGKLQQSQQLDISTPQGTVCINLQAKAKSRWENVYNPGSAANQMCGWDKSLAFSKL